MAKIEKLVDNFQGASLNSSLWASSLSNGATSVQSLGQITLQPLSNTVNSVAEIDSVATYTLISSSIFINLRQAATGTIDSYFQLMADANNLIKFIYNSGTLAIHTVIAGVETTKATLVVYPSDILFFRFREQSGTTYWEVSRDGGGRWITVFSMANPITLTALTVQFGVNEFTGQANPIATVFSNVNFITPEGRLSSGMGMGYGWQIASSTYNATQVAADLAFLHLAGIRKLRLYLPGSLSSADIAAVQALAVQCLQAGFHVRWGVCTAKSNLTLTATQWTAYKTFVTGTIAPWAISVGLPELILGNEEEGHADGTTLTAATVRADIKTMAASVISGGFIGVTAYDSEVNHSNIANWKADGIGTNLYLYFNQYDRLATFETSVAQQAAAFGSRTGISEFNGQNLNVALDGFKAFNNEPDYYNDTLTRIQAMKDYGISNFYWFTFRDGNAVGYTDVYALALTTGAYRQAMSAVLGDVSASRRQLYTSRNYAVSLTGVQLVNVASASAVNFVAANQYSWFGRVYFIRKVGSTVMGVLAYQALDGTSGYQIFIDSNKMRFQERKTNTTWSQTQPSDVSFLNRWNDVIITYDGTAQDIRFYVNGFEQPSAIDSFSWANVVGDTTHALKFAKDSSSENINGFECDVGRVSRVLTRKEILDFSLGIIPSSTDVFLALNEGNGTTLTDGSGNANTCTITSASQWSRQQVPQSARKNPNLTTTPALQFNAATATPRVVVANAASLQGLTSLTVEVFVTLQHLPTTADRIIDFINGNTGFRLQLSGQLLQATVGNGTTTAGPTSTRSLPMGQQVHVALTWDGTNVKIYVDGYSDGSVGLSGGNTGNPAVSLYIGNASSFARAFGGLIQEMRISNSVRYTQNFVPTKVPFVNDANTVALWHMDENTGTTVNDSSSNANTGTMAGTTNPIWSKGGLTKPGNTARSASSGRLMTI